MPQGDWQQGMNKVKKVAAILRFRADDPHLVTAADGHVKVWPNQAGGPADAAPPPKMAGPPSHGYERFAATRGALPVADPRPHERMI
jgi:hypothetical protein